MADKDLDAIIPLMPRQATWIFTTPETKRAMKASMIMEKVAAWRKAHGLGTERLHVKDSVHDAVLSAMKLASSLLTDDGPQPLVYIGGSTFVVSEAAACFR
jgi:dihydrofolate synthase/folylpolyglutamate synthase